MYMVQNSIQDCICDDWVMEYIIPEIKIYICSQNSALLFTSQINQLKEQLSVIFFNR